MIIMYDTAILDTRTARSLFRAYLERGDYANAERVLDCAREDLGGARAYTDAFSLMDTFLAPDKEFSRRLKIIDISHTFEESIKAYETRGEAENASLKRKHLRTYLANRKCPPEHVRQNFNAELKKMREATEIGYCNARIAREHYGMTQLYARKGGMELDEATINGLARVGKKFEDFDALKQFREETEMGIRERQLPAFEMPRSRAEQTESLRKRVSLICFIRGKRRQLREMVKH